MEPSINYQNWCKICDDTQINNIVLNGVFVLKKQKDSHLEFLQSSLQNNDISLLNSNHPNFTIYVDIRTTQCEFERYIRHPVPIITRDFLYIQEAKDLKKKQQNFHPYGHFAPQDSYMIYFDIQSAYSYLKINKECNLLHVFNNQQYRIDTLKLLWQMGDSEIIFNVIMDQISNFLLNPYQNQNNFISISDLNQLGLSQQDIDQINIFRCIDDFLIFSQSSAILQKFSKLFQYTFDLLNIKINRQKSIVVPTKKLKYLQYDLDTTQEGNCYIYSRYNSIPRL